MAQAFLTNIDLSNNELQNFRVHNTPNSSAPTSLAGMMYYDTATNLMKYYNGTTWETFGTATGGVTSFSAGSTGLTPSTGTTGAISLAGTLVVANGGTGATTLTGLIRGNGTLPFTAAAAGTDYQAPLTFSTGLTNTSGTVTVNASQSISTLSNLTSNGFVTTSGGTGALSVTTLGSGVATFLSTPNSANLASAVTDETGSGALVFATSPSLTTPSLAGETFSTTNNVTAGTNAQGQGALTTDINVITTAAANPSGVTLPTATQGRKILIVNKGANAVNVYPATGATIDGLSVNAAISLPVNGLLEFNASSTTQWYSSFQSTVTGTGVTSFQTSLSGLTPNTASTGAVTLAGTLGVSSGGTGVTASSGANSVVLRDANSNISANLISEGYSNVSAAGTTTTLTISSVPNYVVTGSGGQTYKLPDATTLSNGANYTFNNNQSSGTIVIQNNSSSTIATVQSGGYIDVILLSNGTAAGTWDVHNFAPSNVSWSTNTLDYAGSITSATWNGTAVAYNRGGTGQSSAFVAGGIVYGSTTSALAVTAIGTAGQVLTSAGAGTPTWTTPTIGTVTSVTGTSPVVSGGGATPAISLATAYGDTLNPYASKTANFVLAAPNGTTGAPTFRAIVANDVPTLNQNTTGTAGNVTGTVAIANGGTGTNTGSITGTGALTFTAGGTNTNVSLAPNGTGTVDVTSKRITSLLDPTGAQDAATKNYVDNVSAGLSWKASVIAATVGTESFIISSGAVTQITGTTLDGQSPGVNDRILIKNAPAATGTGSSPETNQPANGIYIVTNATTNLTVSRASDANTAAELLQSVVFVRQGTINVDNAFVLTTNTITTLNTTPLQFTTFSSATVPDATTTIKGKVQLATTVQAESKSDTTLVVTPASLATFARKYTTTIGNGSSTSFAVTHGLGSQYVTAQVFDESSKKQVYCDVTLTSGTQTSFVFALAPTTNQYRVVITG